MDWVLIALVAGIVMVLCRTIDGVLEEDISE